MFSSDTNRVPIRASLIEETECKPKLSNSWWIPMPSLCTGLSALMKTVVILLPDPGDVGEGFHVRVSHERRESRQEDVADHPHRPHVRRGGDGLVGDDLGRDELGGAEQNPDVLARIKLAGQTEVDDLDLVRGLGLAEDVLRLQVQVDDVLFMHVTDGL